MSANPLILLVGAEGFEPPTPTPPVLGLKQACFFYTLQINALAGCRYLPILHFMAFVPLLLVKCGHQTYHQDFLETSRDAARKRQRKDKKK